MGKDYEPEVTGLYIHLGNEADYEYNFEKEIAWLEILMDIGICHIGVAYEDEKGNPQVMKRKQIPEIPEIVRPQTERFLDDTWPIVEIKIKEIIKNKLVESKWSSIIKDINDMKLVLRYMDDVTEKRKARGMIVQPLYKADIISAM